MLSCRADEETIEANESPSWCFLFSRSQVSAPCLTGPLCVEMPLVVHGVYERKLRVSMLFFYLPTRQPSCIPAFPQFSFFIRTRPTLFERKREDSRREVVVVFVARHLGELALESPELHGLLVFIRGWGLHRRAEASSRTRRSRQASRTRSDHDDGLRIRTGLEVRDH